MAQTLNRGPVSGTAVKPPSKKKPFVVDFYSTAVGKKYVMAITGIIGIGFVVVHMIGNLKAYLGIVTEGDVAYVIGARRATAIAVRAGGRGDVTATHKLWEINKGSNVSSPVVHGGHLYWAHDSRGSVYCVDAKTGKDVYEERLNPRPGRIYASPLAADGKLYYVSRDAGVFVVAAKPEFELLAHNKIETDASIFNGSPAVADGRLLLRSDRALYCIGK